jgi:hypothetical protein
MRRGRIVGLAAVAVGVAGLAVAIGGSTARKRESRLEKSRGRAGRGKYLRRRDGVLELPHAENQGAPGSRRGPHPLPVGASRGSGVAAAAGARGRRLGLRRELGRDGVVRPLGSQLFDESDARREHRDRELVRRHFRRGPQRRGGTWASRARSFRRCPGDPSATSPTKT